MIGSMATVLQGAQRELKSILFAPPSTGVAAVLRNPATGPRATSVWSRLERLDLLAGKVTRSIELLPLSDSYELADVSPSARLALFLI